LIQTADFAAEYRVFSAERLIVIHNRLSPQTGDYASADCPTGTVERPSLPARFEPPIRVLNMP
jgi:hypothetical protein